MKKGKKIYKRLIILAILAYVAYTLINQQQTLNGYTKDIADLNTQINDQKEYNEELAQKQNDVNSLDFIEELFCFFGKKVFFFPTFYDIITHVIIS